MARYWKKRWEQQLKKGARVVSYTFHMAGWKPVRTIPRDAKRRYGEIIVYEAGKSF